MAECSECLHWEACLTLFELAIGRTPTANGNRAEEKCPNFKDCTKWVEQKPIKTNADRIRAMSDEELTDSIENLLQKLMDAGDNCLAEAVCDGQGECQGDGICSRTRHRDCIRRYLGRPAEEGRVCGF